MYRYISRKRDRQTQRGREREKEGERERKHHKYFEYKLFPYDLLIYKI